MDSQRPRRLSIESLEDRRLLTSYLVDIAVDERTEDTSLSLREAIEFSNANSGPDAIAFDAQLAGQTIELTLGQLQITDDVTITGLGADQLTISGNNSHVILYNASSNVEISGLSLVHGRLAIYNTGDLTVEACTLAGNSGGGGGAIQNVGGSLTIKDSTLANNSASYGGAIYSSGSSLIVMNSTLANNSASAEGGAVFSTLGTVTLTNSTVVQNEAGASGGGIAFRDTLTITNSLVGGNKKGLGWGPDIYKSGTGTIAIARYNVIQDGYASGIVGGVNGNQVGVDPLLDPAGLQDNGGPTQTIALMANSPAINKGSNALAIDPAGAPLEFDQRGAGYPRVGTGTVDVGAFEVQSVPPAPGETETLGGLIDYILTTFNGVPPGSELVFHSGDAIPGTEQTIPDSVQIGQVPAALGDGSDLQLDNFTLTFPTNLAFNGATWSGGVGVTAIQGALHPGLLNIVISDDGDDADMFAVVGEIDLVAGNPVDLKLDDLDAEDIGWPAFLDIEISDLELKFPDFWGDDSVNTLELDATFLGIDTGNNAANDLLSADNPLFGLSVEGGVVGLELDMDVIRTGVRDLASGMINFPTTPIVHLDGVAGQVSGKLFGVGSISAGFVVNQVMADPDGDGTESSALYAAVTGSISLAGSGGFGLAFAFSELGPLQFFVSAEVPIVLEPVVTGLAISEMRLGVRFNTTIEDLQTETDFMAVAGEFNTANSRVTLTIPNHDLAVGNDFRIRDAGNEAFDGDFTVLSVNGDEVTYEVDANPGGFIGDAEIIRLTITDPLDLRDTGLKSGIAPPESILDWKNQLDQAVTNQIEAGNDVWDLLFKEVVFGGGASLSFDPRIPDFLLQFNVDFMIGTHLDLDAKTAGMQILLKGEMALLDGFATLPASLYADLSADVSGFDGRFLYLQDIPDLPVDLDPLLVYRGEASFGTLDMFEVLNAEVNATTPGVAWDVELELNLDNPSNEYRVGEKVAIQQSNAASFNGVFEVIAISDDANTITIQRDTDPGTWEGGGVVPRRGFQITLEGGVDLNIPAVTTLTLEGGVGIEFIAPALPADPDLEIKLSFDATLSETNLGNIASASGVFHATLDVGLPPVVEVWGAAILDTDFGFLEPIGLFAEAEGLLRINSSNEAKPDEILLDVDNNPVAVALPAESFALRLDGGVDFRIDFNADHTFAESESVLQIGGIFVLEFSAEQGFNVAIFDEQNDQVVPAGLRLGPKNSPLLEFGVLGFLAIRSDGFAADLVLTTNTSLPLGLASVEATAVFIVNTTGNDVVFEVPGGATDPNRPTGLSLSIPDAAPANPSGILNHSQSDDDLQALITGSPTWEEGAPGPYGVVFLAGELEMLSVLELDVSGYVLLSEEVVSLEANFSAAGNFFNLASASAHGTLFFSSQGEFVLDVGGSVQLGPDGFNISGSAELEISHLDSDGRGSQGDGNFVLDIHGSLAVSAEIFYINVGSVSVDVAYNSGSGVITVGINYPEPYWAKSCTRVWGVRVCVYYPSFRTATYTFEVGKLTVDPPVLGQVDTSGVLTLNVGPQAGARNLAVGVLNEDVVIEDVSAGSQMGRKISVTMFGLTQSFDNVTKILIPDMGDGNDSVEIATGVQTEVEAYLGDGDDRLANDGSAAVIAYGGEGNDQLNGGDAIEQMFGGPGDDVIAGGGGQDVMDGGLGVDEFIVEANNLASAHFDGGADEDKITIVGDSSAHDLRVTTEGSHAGTIGSYSEDVETGSVTFANMENILLSGGFDQEDFVLLSEEQVVASGETGDDDITVASGSVVVTINEDTFAFSGSDVLQVFVDGQDGNDNILVFDNVVIPCAVFGNSGNDTIQGGSADDVLDGGPGDDLLLGGDGQDELIGGDGGDQLLGEAGDDQLDGGEGNDHLDGGEGNDGSLVDSGDEVTINEGDSFGFVASFIDSWNPKIRWGDGDVQDGVVADGTVSGSHVYADNNGTYLVQVTNADGSEASTNFSVMVSNVAPTAGSVTAPIDPVEVDNPVQISLGFSDAGFSTETFTYDVNWGDGIIEEDLLPTSVMDGSAGVHTTGTIRDDHAYTTPGVYAVTVTVSDDDGGAGQSIFEFVVVFDPNGGFVTGGGWIDSPEGAYPADPTLTGKANVGFVSKYNKNADEPTGETELRFEDMNFRSTRYQWLVLADAISKYRGDGTINGEGDYGFMVTAVDGDYSNDDLFTEDTYRIKIWDKANGNQVVYDNRPGQGDDSCAGTELGGGNIVVHDEGKELQATNTGSWGMVGQVLTPTLLAPVVDQAISYWAAQSVDVRAIQHVEVHVASLNDSVLGVASSSNLIWIDRDAAGHGWTVGAPSGGMDLFHVVAHEIGHKLGLDHDSTPDVMGAALAPLATLDHAPASLIPAASILGLGQTVFVQGPPLLGFRSVLSRFGSPEVADTWARGERDQFFAALGDHTTEIREERKIEPVDEALWELEHEAKLTNLLDAELLDALVAL